MKLSEIYKSILLEGDKKMLKVLKNQNRSTLPKIPTDKIFFHNVPGVEHYHNIGKEAQPHIGTNAFKKERVDVKMIIPTQKNVNIHNLKDVEDRGENTGAELIKDQQFYYVLDGHHRIAMEILRGSDTVLAKVYTNTPS
tara:strand:+ start:34926 stop:35342 length:417 start_codon:yes stop_codon:yes gene_type:complete